MDEKLLQEAQEALSHVRGIKEKFDKGIVTEAAFKEALDKTNATLDAQEKASQEAFKAFKEKEKETDELKERADKLEKHLLKMGSKEAYSMKESGEYKAFNSFLVSGKAEDLAMLTKDINRTDIITEGGALVPTMMFQEIIKNVTEMSPLRSLARVTQIDGKSIDLPTRTALLSAGYEGETESSGTSTSKYGIETFTPYRQAVTVPVTHDQLMNSAFDFEREIMADVVEAFAKGEGNKFINGTGIKSPEGILTNADVLAGAYTSAASGAIDLDDLINLSGQMKAGYNGSYSFNRTTNALLRTLKATDGHYLWQLQAGGNFNTLNGFGYVIDQELPDVAAGAIPVLFADFAKGYRIVDRTAMMMIRDDYTSKKQAIVELEFMRWNTGKVQQAEAIKALKVKA
ncbi:MAG: phage major capsid protein [Gammaproteobacteria bacterium]|nr:phage major capsid protein [Gammaproteobacteria bacterium]